MAVTCRQARAGGRSAALRGRRFCTAAVACGALLGATVVAVPAAARPYQAPPPLADLLTQLKALYGQVTAATSAYERARAVAERERAQARDVDRRLADERVVLAAGRTEIGLLARQMYQDGGLSPYLAVLGGDTLQDFFGRRRVLGRVARHQREVLADLAGAQARLRDLNAAAQRALDRGQAAQTAADREKGLIAARLRQIEGLLAALPADQLTRLRTLDAAPPLPPALR